MTCQLAYIRGVRVRLLKLALGAAALAAALLTDLTVGASGMSPADVVSALMAGPDGDRLAGVIIWSIRLPMTLTALCVGFALALAGLGIQVITGNPLASPSTLGITSAAGFGAASAISFGAAVGGALWIGTALSAFAAALLVSAAIYRLGSLRGMRPSTLILSGIVMNFFFMALQQYLQYSASPEVAQLISGWTFGNLEKSTWVSAGAAGFATAAGLLYFIRRVWALTALTVGEERAASLGVPVRRLRLETFALASFLIAAAVGFIGTVGFVGLVAPHLARLVIGEDQRFLIPATLLAGGTLMLAGSVTAKLLTVGAMLPVGIITSLVGVPFLLVLLIRDRGGDL